MGVTVEVKSLDEMCDLMCDNVLPKQEYWVFTFGQLKETYGDRAGKAVRVFADSYIEAREKMCKRFGNRWAFQYPADVWEEFENNPEKFWYLEEVVEEIR